MSVPVRLRAALLTLAACLGLLSVLLLPSAATAAGSPDLAGEINSPTILHGERVPVSIRATNPSGGAYGYNVSFRVVLPAGVSYSGGAPIAPTTIAGPGAGETTLIFRNVADISQNATQALDFEVVYDTARYDVGDRFTIQAQAFANDNPRWIPRFDRAGLPLGPAADSYTGYTAVLNGVTTINAIDIEKDEPSWEGEIMRGVHDHQTTYTLTVRNNGIRRTDGVTVVDYLPAGLEFLGCAGNPDNTTDAPTNPGTRVEYPGAGPIVVGAVSDCLTPSRVETVNVDPDGAGPLPAAVYTRVEWSLGTLASTTTRRISYRAAIPIRENTMTWSGATPATTGAQAVNLDNNNGPETRDEQELTNYATAAGRYNGTLAVSDEDWLTRTAEDWVVHKESDTSELVQGALTIWTLTFQTSEYRSVRDAVVRDTVPSGLCPVGAVNFTTGNSADDSECAPTGDLPTQPYTSVTENADGTFTIVWDRSTFPQLAQTNVSQTFTLRFPTITRTRYQSNFDGTTPILTRDSITNSVTTDADQIVRCIAPGTPDCTTTGPEINHDAGYGTGVSIPDASEASELAARPEIKKRVAQSGTVCRTATYVETVPTYHPGDRVCWLLHVTFPTGVDTNPQVISDYLPTGTRYELGTDAAYDPPTGANTVSATVDETNASNGVLSWEITGRTVPRGSLVFERTISTIVGPSGTTAQNGEVLGNLMKFAARNTAGVSEPLRDQRDIVVETPVLDLLKGVQTVERSGTVVLGPYAANNDHRPVEASDRVTYRLDVTNSGGQDAEAGEVWDNLPSDYDCTVVSRISNGGACIDGGIRPDRIVWSGLAVARGATATLTYTAVVPADVGPNRTITNTAGIRTYAGRTNLNTLYPYFPADNVDPSVDPRDVNAPAADDPSDVYTNLALVRKSAATDVTENGNNGAQASIGERITYTVDITVPAGTTLARDGLVTDVLDSTTRQAYVAGSARLRYSTTAPNTASITGGTTPGVQFPSGYAVAPDGADGVITLTFDVIVADVAGNTRASGNLTNRASLTWTDPIENGKRADSNTVTTQIVEPLIGQTKGDDRHPDRVVPGEIVEYTLTTTNRSAPGRVSTAHDLVTVDRVPIGVTPIGPAPGNTPLADGASTADGGVWNTAARTITWRAATLVPDATLVRRYRVSVDDPAIGGAELTNVVDTTATSLDSAHTDRRTTGSGYAANARDTIQIQGASVSKSVTPARATVGEHVGYTLTVTIPADVSLYDVTVTDLLPDTIGFDRFTGSSCVSGACPSVQTYDPVRNGNGTTTVAWDLGDIASPLAAPAVLRLTYQGHVLARDNGGTDVVAGDTGVNTVFVGTNRSDRETFDRTAIPTGFEDRSPDASATVTVTEPRMAIDKQVSVSGGAFGDGPATALSNDTLGYRVIVRNTGDAPAYDLTVEDLPDAELENVTIGTLPSGVTVTKAWSSADRSIVWHVAGPIAPGDTVTIPYTARLVAASNLSDGQAIDNTARLPSYWGVPESERRDPANTAVDYREYRDGGSDSTRVVLDFPTLTLDKTTGLSGFPDRGRAQVGQAFPWRVTVTNTSATATTSNVVVTDTLPANWVYVANSATLTPGGASEPAVTANAGGDRLAWTVATLAPGASVTIAYSARPTADAATTPGLGVDANVNSALVSSARDEAGNSGNAGGPYGTPADDARATLQIPSLTIAKTPDGGTVTAGGRATFSVLVRNTGAVVANNLVIEDTLPAGMTYRAGDATAAPSAGFAERSASGSTIVWTVGSLAAGADVTITVPVSVAASVLDGTTLTNSASVRSDEQPDPITDDGTLDVSAETNLAIVKDGPASYTPGEQYSWSLQVTSAGPSDAQNVVVSDPLPAGVTFVSADAPCTFAAGVVSCALGTVAPGFDRTYAVTVRADPARTGRLLNTAEVSSDTTETDASDNDDDHDAAPDPIADVTVEKTVSTAAIPRGGTATFRLTARNIGPSVARDVELSDRLPAGLTFVSADSAACRETAGTVACAFGDLAVGASASVNVVVRGDLVGSYVNRAEVTTTTPEPVGGGEPNDDEATLEVGPVTNLSIVKSGPATVAAGGRIVWQLTVRNDGPDDATGVTVTDRLPAGVTEVAAPAGCTVAGGEVSCAVGALASGDTVELEIGATVPVALGSATLVNNASVTGNELEPDLSDNSSEATTTVGPAADLAIVKQGPATVAADGTIAWTLIATNNGPSTATGVVVTDVLPGGVVFGGATASQGGCSLAGTTLSCALGTLASGASAQITVTAQVPASLEGAQLLNVATIGGAEPDPVPSNNRAELPTRVGPPDAGNYDLAIDKQLAAGARAVLGGSFAYTLRVSNSGPATATSVVVTDTLPQALKGRSASVSGGSGGSCTIRGQVVRCPLGTLAAGASRLVTVRVTAVRAGSVRNAAVVSAAVADRNPANDRDAVTVRVTSPRATLKLTKRALGRQPVARGGSVRFRATVTNASAVAASDVVVCDTLPRGLTLRTTGGGRLRAGRLCWQVGLLPARASRTFTFTARVLRDASGTRITNVANATASNAAGVSAKATIRLGGLGGVLPGFGRGGGVTG
ncbi:hypothetical protein Q5424_25940 [Conexibacter sp. JD483]|uniref:DUF7933 domain-containing protein n=1 Tax=unclassified Conexibacter TaxID=2627773 RepID=UPI0027176665|nr:MULTISPECIES: hypothetical protein [unclassified Conexibacter]MDO8189430.1 hypothetical protein [Conexibacter sp. CPCC 205706]MDO8199172.1 hypothetical protein [Conexibacter sp. CPCC 205762]MDR9372567.1 hypothetical protein [Conexibacter sp. JD483]